jgi:hypothetical protein
MPVHCAPTAGIDSPETKRKRIPHVNSRRRRWRLVGTHGQLRQRVVWGTQERSCVPTEVAVYKEGTAPGH